MKGNLKNTNYFKDSSRLEFNKNKNKDQSNSDDSNNLDQITISLIKKMISKKRKQLSEIDINFFSYYFSCLLKAKNKQKKREQQIFYNSMQKISKRLDLIRYVKNYQILKVLSSLILNDEQNFYMRNTFQKVISSSTEEENLLKKEEKKKQYVSNQNYIYEIARMDYDCLDFTNKKIIDNFFDQI